MPKEKIAIIYTTFLRDELMEKTIKSIMDNWQDNYVLLVGDQNKNTEFNNVTVELKDSGIMGDIKICRFNLPYDCGLSYARNYLVDKAHDMGIKYCLISADSIAFNDKYDFEPIIDFIKCNCGNVVVGLKLANRQPFEYDLTIDRELGKFILDKPSRGIITSTLGNTIIHYQRCDIVKNFFIAPTKYLIKYPWNNELKLCEHETFFYQLKNGVEVYYTDKISANYIDEKSDEYKQMRNRLYTEFVAKMRKINEMADNRGGWIQYNWRNF